MSLAGLLTSNGKFWTTGDELQKVPTLSKGELAHDLKKVPDTSTVHVEAMIGLDRIEKRC